MGDIRSTVEQDNLHELVVGTHSRSGGQYDIWEAVFAPWAGRISAPVWDKRTGRIDAETVRFMKEHYDLGNILTRTGRRSVRSSGESWWRSTSAGRTPSSSTERCAASRSASVHSGHPVPQFAFAYGATDGHCWSGDHEHLNAYSRLTYHERLIPKLVEGWVRNAPRGVDVSSWRR
jgi:hypothetical protein